MYAKIAQTFNAVITPESVRRYCAEIDRRDRWFSFKHMYETARYLADEMRRLGMEGVEILDVPATGEGGIEERKAGHLSASKRQVEMDDAPGLDGDLALGAFDGPFAPAPGNGEDIRSCRDALEQEAPGAVGLNRQGLEASP